MRALLWITLAMPAVIFLAAGKALVDRLRLESRGLAARATVTSYKYWVDDTSHHDVSTPARAAPTGSTRSVM